MSDQVASICRAGYYQLRQLRPVIPSMSEETRKTLVHAFITSRLDYSNSVLYGVSDSLLGRLQSVQNAAARLVTDVRRFDHISPVLRRLHWLPVRQRVQFKVAALVHRSLSSNAPGYLADDCHLVAETRKRQLRSSDFDSRVCVNPCTHNKFGDRAFAAAGPRTWNALPRNLRLPNISYPQFKRLLKTHLFEQ